VNPMPSPRSSLLAALFAGTLACTAAWSTSITSTPDEPGAPASPLLESMNRSWAVQPLPSQGATGHDAMQSLSQGRWASACATATNVLARRVADVEALGVFAVCSAITGDRDAAATAQARLKEAEPLPYFGPLTQGVLQLLDKQPEKAQASWWPLLQVRSDDPLVLYFEGEALHARQQSDQAVTAFRRVLEAWPDFAPALTAVARLSAGPKASAKALQTALSLAERATKIEPTNHGYWRLLAQLCRRTGQVGRANAIALQYLRPPSLPALR
jgi:tetratricopeptide (TPR) repeat protein